MVEYWGGHYQEREKLKIKNLWTQSLPLRMSLFVLILGHFVMHLLHPLILFEVFRRGGFARLAKPEKAFCSNYFAKPADHRIIQQGQEQEPHILIASDFNFLNILMLRKLTQGIQRLFSQKITVREALNKALDEELARDKNTFVIGEEVANYNGAYKITKGLLEKHGAKRVVDTPITESGFTGLASGAALMGLTPIVEFMTMNFAMQAIDHIINSSAKLHYMSAGQLKGGIVFRGLNGPAAAVAAQHSQCFASWYSNIPGLITISPYDAEDNKGLLKAAIRSGQVVVFLQNQNLYGQTFEISDQALSPDYIIPIGKAKIMRQGKHVTIVAYSRSVKYSLQAAETLAKEGIECQVINLRTIKPLDRDAIVKSVKKTSRLVTVQDGFPQSGIGAQIGAIIHQTDAFNYLDAPIERVTAVDIPMPYAKLLEDAVVPGPDTIAKAVRKAMKGVRL